MSLDDRIDELYRLPLGDFTASRNALAKNLPREEAKRVRALAKPTVVPWGVNQLFWRARPAYDRLLECGRALREAQIAALTGEAGDLRRAAETHRRALTDAVRQTTELAAKFGAHPDVDDLARMLEALSLTPESACCPGRFTEPLQPAGFEALAGVQPVTRPVKIGVAVSSVIAKPRIPSKADDVRSLREQETERRLAEERRIAERRRLEAALGGAEQAAERARAAETRAREALNLAVKECRAAEATVEERRKALGDHR